jgi:hypothetical protein
MKRQVAVLSVALAVTVVGFAVVSSNAQQPGPPTGTLQLVALSEDNRFTFVNNPLKQGKRRPPSPGDFGVLRHTKLRNTSGERIGNARVVFTTTGRDRAIAHGVFQLAEGLIVFDGIADGPTPHTHAITGGTGAYNGAAGTLTVEGRARSTIFTFSFSG